MAPHDHILVDVEVRDLGEPIGSGLFLREPVRRGDVVALFGGRAVSAAEFRTLPDEQQRRSIQVADSVYLVGSGQHSVGDYINHSCDPTTVLIGEITLAAARDLSIGEQLTYDYATSDSTPYDEFECACGASRCREKVTGEDWMNPELQMSYRGNFSPYLQRKIDDLGD